MTDLLEVFSWKLKIYFKKQILKIPAIQEAVHKIRSSADWGKNGKSRPFKLWHAYALYLKKAGFLTYLCFKQILQTLQKRQARQTGRGCSYLRQRLAGEYGTLMGMGVIFWYPYCLNAYQQGATLVTKKSSYLCQNIYINWEVNLASCRTQAFGLCNSKINDSHDTHSFKRKKIMKTR